MALSAFRPLGLLRLSSAKPLAKRIYAAMIGGLSGQFDASPGTHVEASIFAKAMGLARSAVLIQHAWEQVLPMKALEMLPVREREYGLAPGPNDTIGQRRRAVAARKLLPLGCSRTNVENALRTLLGSDFVAYRPTTVDEMVSWPAALGAVEMNLQPPSVRRKLVTLSASVASLGVPLTVPYALLAGPPPPPPVDLPGPAGLSVGDVLTVDPGRLGLEEAVAVTAVGGGTLTATFTKAHDSGAIGTTMPFPNWQSSKRHSLIVISAAAAIDPEKRRKIHELMQRIARGVSTWSITDNSGPFLVGVSRIGVTPFGAINVNL